jgi:trimeric autotransporter adhesin
MLIRFLAITLSFLLPALAQATTYWAITATTAPAAFKTSLTAVRPTNFGNYTTPGGATKTLTNVTRTPYPSVSFNVAPVLGYTVKVDVDGARAGTTAGVYPVAKGTVLSHTIVATYTAATFTVTAQQIGGGSISPTVTAPAGASPAITITPDSNYLLTGATIDGTLYSLPAVPAGVSVSGGPAGAVYTFGALGANHTIQGAFAPVPAARAVIANGNSIVPTGTTGIFIDGSPSSSNVIGTTYSWAASCGTLTPTGPNAKTANYDAPASIGSCTITLTINAAGVSPNPTAQVVIATQSAVIAETQVCLDCHDGVNGPAVTGFTSSAHYGVKSCADCHNPGRTLSHSYASLASMANVCRNCHTDAQGAVPGHPVEIGANTCTYCHNPHTAAGVPRASHYNNITSAGYPASYVTSRSACANCHVTSATNSTRRQEWSHSKHAALAAPAWSAEDFKTKSGCVQCHSTTGFLAYSTGKITAAWGVASDKTKEALTCIGCHKDIATGAVRSIAPLRPYADDPYLNRDLGTSNICMPCHSGRKNGASITAQLAALADFGNLPFIDPHYRAAGGTLHGKAGYHFVGPTGYSFYSSNGHRRLGFGDLNGSGTSGPCVACHRTSTNPHSNEPLISTLCGNCHGASFTGERLSADKAAYGNALGVLNAMLTVKGYSYAAPDRLAPATPRFSATNWGSDRAGADTMGAAFNYALLIAEPGAYAHNPAYARQLILDSIDYLYNGAVTGSVEGAAAYLVAQNKITPEAAAALDAYRTANNCTSCHPNNTGSHTAHLNGGFGCTDCHHATAASNSTLVPGSTAHTNGVVDLEAGPGRSFAYSPAPGGGNCSAISCHNNGSATWGGTLGCDGCHDAPPATASHLKHYGGTVAQAGYGATGIAQDLSANESAYVMNCGNCHPMNNAKHGNGIVDVELYSPQAPAGSLKALNPASAAYAPGATVLRDSRGIAYSNGSCSNVYCHSYKSWSTPTGVPNPTTCNPAPPADLVTATNYRTVTWGGAPLDCAGCHANPPRTRYPENAGAAGDSHSWIGPVTEWGYPLEYLHTSNMGTQAFSPPWPEPISCLYCHNGTVRQANSFSYDTSDPAYPVIMGNVPIVNFSNHVNGKNDVAFEKQLPAPAIGSWSDQKLTNASYEPATKTCSNVICHPLRTQVKWGTPYKGEFDYDCARCHDYGVTCQDAASQLSRQPSISSTPATTLATPGYAFSYALSASEPGGGALSYTLPVAPQGMTISAAGALSWTPRADQMGSAPVKIVVSSAASSGILIAIQEFSITVQLPQPSFTSTPVTTATAWKAYSYPVVAKASSGMPAVSYALTSFPSGMTISATSGNINWTPTDQQVGSFPITVTATSAGNTASQSFTVTVAPSPITITSTPVTAAQTQVAYSYPVTATMSGVGSFSYSLLVKPLNMTINTSTGVISWTPQSTPIASYVGSFPVTVQVSANGYSSRQSYTLVSTASPITVTSNPGLTAKVGVPYSYSVVATMPGGGPFTYTLPVKPGLMTVSTAGVISWTPTSLLTGTRPVSVTVTKGASTVTQSFNLVVSP